ncbi:MAG: TasA family protein [Clostridia bacterium]
MKKRIFIGALVLACVSIMACGSLAYFTKDAKATNTITAGGIDMQLEELAIPVGGGDPVPFEDVSGVMPGAEVSKIVQVKNTGANDMYVRVQLNKAIELAEGVSGEADTSLVTMDLNTEDWTEQDGYYYYNTAVAPGETTEPLFTTVTFAKEMDNMYQNSKATVTVYAAATQVANNGDTVFEAAGWPEA